MLAQAGDLEGMLRGTSSDPTIAEHREKRNLLANIRTKIIDISDWTEKVFLAYDDVRAMSTDEHGQDQSGFRSVLGDVNRQICYPLERISAQLNAYLRVLDDPEIGKTYSKWHPFKAKYVREVTHAAAEIYRQLGLGKLQELDEITERTHANGYSGIAAALGSFIDHVSGKTETPEKQGWRDYIVLKIIIDRYQMVLKDLK
ncbi:hypothetical protein HYY69_00475 [Candidatus Woesearchaeota archaeon]|nr:hypothetical protein [Candidatus Woesearchaeota archaeon]